MTTAVRIKRKAGEIAADAIVLAPKIARTGNEEAVGGTEANYTFHYAGSFKCPDSPEAKEAIRRARGAKHPKQDPKLHLVDLQSKLRDEYRSATKKKRLQTVLQHRAVIEELCTEEVTDNDINAARESASSLFRLYDVLAQDTETDKATKENVDPKEEEKTSEITCNNVSMVRGAIKEKKEDLDYVYDVYYSAAQFSLLREDEYSVFKVGLPDAFAPETAYDSDSDLGCEACDDDSDSNAEDNWRNDYPDEDFGKSGYFYGEEGTDFMSGQMTGLALNFDDSDAEH